MEMGMIVNLTNKKIFISKAIIYLIRAQNFPETNIFYPLIRTRRCAYQAVRNVSFLENFACLRTKVMIPNKKDRASKNLAPLYNASNAFEDHSISTYVKYSKKLLLLLPYYIRIRK